MNKVTMDQYVEWYSLGDDYVVSQLIYLNPEHEQLHILETDCWEHEIFKENGESYDVFKDRYIEITKKYVKDWNEVKLEYL